MSDWTADVYISSPQPGVCHVYAKTVGSDTVSALTGAEFVLDNLAKGKKAHIRTMPEAFGDRDFDTKIWRYHGYTRFTVLDEPGEWETANPDMTALFSAAVSLDPELTKPN